MRLAITCFFRLLSAIALPAVSAGAQASDEIWRSDWLLSAPPTLVLGYPNVPEANAAFASNGDIVFGTSSYANLPEFQFVRMTPDGGLRWSANLAYGLGVNMPSVIVPTDDGGALVGLTYGQGAGIPGYAARIDASGGIIWQRFVDADAMSQVGTDRVVFAGCSSLTMVDAASGDVLWQATMNVCSWTPHVAVDEEGASYTLARRGDEIHIEKRDIGGELLWGTPTGFDSNLTIVAGASLGRVYVLGDELHAYDTSSGDEAWLWPAWGKVVLAGSPAEPVMIDSSLVTGLSAQSGSPRWMVPMASSGIGEGSPDSVYVWQGSGTLARLDPATGLLKWTASLPTSDALGDALLYFRAGGLANGSISTVARPFGMNPAPPVVERLPLASGTPASAVAVPTVAQAPFGISIVDGGSVLGVETAWTSAYPEVRVRRVDAGTGATLWETSAALDTSAFSNESAWNVSSDIGTSGSTVAAVAAGSVSSGSSNSAGALWMSLLDASTGDLLWQQAIREADQETTRVYAPIADPAGDYFVGTGEQYYCGSSNYPCARQKLMKIDKDDGHVVWTFDNETDAWSLVYPQTFAVAGSDPVVLGPFSGALASATAVSLDGASGAVRWSSDVLGPFGAGVVFPDDDGIVVVGSGWAKLDPATGATLWTGPAFLPACTAVCNPVYDAVLDDHDVLIAGEADYRPVVARLRGDGSGSYELWRLDPNRSDVRSAATMIRADSNSRLWVGLLRSNLGGMGGLYVLGEIDRDSGALLSQQVLRNRSGDPADHIRFGAVLGAPANSRVLLNTYTQDAPAPTASGNVLVDATISAHGNLAVALDVDPTGVHAGDTLAFHARLTYSGDAPIEGARMNVYLPWSSGARDVACTASSATNCVADVSSGNVRVSVDLASGAVVDIDGRVPVLDTRNESSTVSVVAWGPVGLDEPDTLDNLARRIVSQGLFANGFD